MGTQPVVKRLLEGLSQSSWMSGFGHRLDLLSLRAEELPCAFHVKHEQAENSLHRLSVAGSENSVPASFASAPQAASFFGTLDLVERLLIKGSVDRPLIRLWDWQGVRKGRPGSLCCQISAGCGDMVGGRTDLPGLTNDSWLLIFEMLVNVVVWRSIGSK